VACPHPLRELERARKRLARWRNILDGADALNTRLLSSDVSPAMLDRLLGGEWSVAARPMPPWASTLAAVFSLAGQPGDMDDRSYDPARPLPFQEVLAAFILHARKRLHGEAGAAINVLSLSAITALERQLLAHLTFVASLTLGRDFYEFRFKHAPASALEKVWRRQETSRQIYSEYVRHMQRGGLVELLDNYPVLARLLCQSLDQWTSASVNFCRRFLDDFSDLRAFFGWRVDRAEGAVERLRTDLSDRHRAGQTVTECVLRTNDRVVYKPRSVQPETAFYQFIGWLNDRGLSSNLRQIRALDRTTHGWVESVLPAPCDSEAEVNRFYLRAGMLLGVLHALATGDIHCENLIASGEHPVVVDLETLLSDPMDGEPSVLNTGMLPRWQTASDGHRFDMSSLGADETQDAGIGRLAWESINTDQMTLSDAASLVGSTAHRVHLGDALPPVSDYLPSFLVGFQELYACLTANRRELISDDRFLSSFDNLELRILIRSTSTYTGLQLRLLHPEFLRDGLDRSIELEWLARPLSGTASPMKGRIFLYERERTAMELLDVPHFSTSEWKNTEDISGDEDLMFLCAERDSQVLRRRLATFSPANCARQLAIIEEAVQARFGGAV
jgi:type 2 lantibiotic biosynthesis protein LanM